MDISWSTIPAGPDDGAAVSGADWLTLQPGTTVMHGRFIVSQHMPAEPPGATFLAQDSLSGQPAMLRLLRTRGQAANEILALARQEMRRVAGSPHPYIVRGFDIDRHGDALLIATEPHSMSLRRTLVERRLTLDDALTVARHVAAALAFTHAQGVLYGILTPATVELTASGTARLSAAGLWRIADLLRDTYPPDIADRPGYLAPEEHHSQDLAAATDIFHFGALLWELTLGDAPPTRDPLAMLATKDAIPHALSDIIAQCLQPVPQQRVADLLAVGKQLRAVHREIRGQPPTHSLAKLELMRAPTEHLDETFPRLTNSPAGDDDEDSLERHAVTPDNQLRASTGMLVTLKRPHISADAHQALNEFAVAEADTVKQPTPAISFFTRLRSHFRRRSLLLGIVVAIVALVALLYGTGVYLSAAAPRPRDDFALKPNATTTLTTRALPYRVTHTITLGSGQSLHIEAGVTLAFAPGTSIILRGGDLEAAGTTATPVIFTTTGDPAIGGSGAQAGAWGGIISQAVPGGANGHIALSYATIRFAGVAKGAALTCQAGSLVLTDSLQSDSTGVGLTASTGCWGEVTRTTFERDAGDAADVTTSALRFHDNVVLGSAVSLP